MSRTYRRRNRTDEYRWVLRDWSFAGVSVVGIHDRRSAEGRRALARFHWDAMVTMSGAAPRWYRKAFDRRLRNFDEREVRRWIVNPDTIHCRACGIGTARIGPGGDRIANVIVEAEGRNRTGVRLCRRSPFYRSRTYAKTTRKTTHRRVCKG